MFLLAYRPGVASRNLFKEGLEVSFMSQDFYILSAKDMQNDAQMPWNEMGSVPLSDWLHSSSTPVEEKRLRALGNVVMPRCASFSLSILGHQFHQMQ